MNSCTDRFPGVTAIDVGCGSHKRPGYFGIDLAAGEAVDRVHDLATTRWPFDDGQIEKVFSNHCFEHLACPLIFLREMLRVCRDGAEIEIWTPYGRSNEAFGYGHHIFLTEMHWRHICWEYDRHYLADVPGYFEWVGTNYTIAQNVVQELTELGVPIAFALQHLFNIAPEWGVSLVARKSAARAPGPQYPIPSYSPPGKRDRRHPIEPHADLTRGFPQRMRGLLRRWIS